MKRFLSTVMSICLLLTLPGCNRPLASPVSTAETGAVELSFMLPQSHYKDFLREAIDRFEKEYPNIHVDPQIIPDNQWVDLVKRKVAVGDPPDLIRIDKGLIIDIGANNFTEFGKEEPWYGRVLPEQLESKLIDDKLYGLPIGANSAIIIAYNPILFETHGVRVPESMDELRQACVAFKMVGVTPLYASDKDSWTTGLGFNASAPQAVPMSTWDDLLSGRLRWSEVPQFAEILETFACFRADGYTNSDYLEATYASAVSSMAEGNTAMYITGQFFINDVRRENPDLELMATAVPYTGGLLTTIPGPGQISLFTSSPHPEEAKLFLNWFSQPDNMDVFNAGWGHTAVFADQHLQLPLWQQALNDKYISKRKTVPQIDSIISGIDLNNLWGYQQEMLAGTLTAQQVLERWDAAFAAQIKE